MKLTKASSIADTSISWLWPGKVPIGVDTLIEGDPGVSKSALTCLLAAHVSTGKDWPDNTPCPKGNVIICNAEDPESEVIKPRLKVAGADLSKVSILVPSGPDDTGIFTIPDNIPALEKAAIALDARLIILDPLSAFLSGKVDDYRDHSIRRALRQLEVMAKKIPCAVVIVRHLNKSVGKAAIYRGSGSIGIIGSVRSALSVAIDPSDKNRRIMAASKSNWAKGNTGIAYRVITGRYVSDLGEQIETAQVVWDGEVNLNADDLLAIEADPAENAGLSEAVDFLKTELFSGAVKTGDLFSRATKVGVARKALFRAAKFMGVIKAKEGFGDDGVWTWQLLSPDEKEIVSDFAFEKNSNSETKKEGDDIELY